MRKIKINGITYSKFSAKFTLGTYCLDEISLNENNLKEVEVTLSHELEHAYLDKILRKFGYDSEIRELGCIFVSSPSKGDYWAINELMQNNYYFRHGFRFSFCKKRFLFMFEKFNLDFLIEKEKFEEFHVQTGFSFGRKGRMNHLSLSFWKRLEFKNYRY